MTDSIEVSNKIISADVLMQIFEKMNEKVESLMRISREEEQKNMALEYSYQTYKYLDQGSNFTFTVYYYDNTSIKYDNYISFITTFTNRIDEIKEIDVSLRLSYKVKEINDSTAKYHNQSISMAIYEHKASMDFRLESDDRQLQDLYEFIKIKVQESPIKYDFIIQKKSLITNVIALTKGFIPACVLGLILVIAIPAIRPIFAQSYVLFPIAVIILTFMLGNTLFSFSTSELYKNITPKLEYAGYSQKSGSIYKEDIDDYTKKSEILIGKNVDNMNKRQAIQEKYNKYKKYIPYELGILVILSIIVLFLK